MKKGFTLLELMVVVLIIGVLSAIAAPQYLKSVERSRASEGITYVSAISKALSAHFAERSNCNVQINRLPLDLAYNTMGTNTDGRTTFVTGKFTYSIGDNCSIVAERNAKAEGKRYTIRGFTLDTTLPQRYRGSTVCEASKTATEALESCRLITSNDPEDCNYNAANSCFFF